AEALSHYAQVQRRQPGNADALLGLARCRLELGQTEEARGLLDLLLAAEPRNAQALAARGKVALQRDQFVEAEDWLRQAVIGPPCEGELVYSSPQCLQGGKRDGAGGWVPRSQRIAAAPGRIREVPRRITENPRDPDLRCEVGQLLLRNGQEKEGLRWLDSALL